MTILISLLIHITCTQNMKSNICMDIKKHKHENCLIRTKIRNVTTDRICRTFFLLFSVDLDKQNKLVNNN